MNSFTHLKICLEAFYVKINFDAKTSIVIMIQDMQKNINLYFFPYAPTRSVTQNLSVTFRLCMHARSAHSFKQACAFARPVKSLRTLPRTSLSLEYPELSRSTWDAENTPLVFRACHQRSHSICSRNQTGSYWFPRTHAPMTTPENLYFNSPLWQFRIVWPNGYNSPERKIAASVL